MDGQLGHAVGSFLLEATGPLSIEVGFRPSVVEFRAAPPVNGMGVDAASSVNTSQMDCYAGTSLGCAGRTGEGITQAGIHSGGSGNSINAVSMMSSDVYAIVARHGDQNANATGYVKAKVSSFDPNGFTLQVDQVDRPLLVLYIAMKP